MNCKNCHKSLEENSDYCNACGGRVIRNRLTLKNLFEHFSETYFDYDNKLLRTFVYLFKKPEEVICTYISGVRKRYVNPISYLAITITISGIYFFILNKYFPNALTEMSNPYGNQLQLSKIKEVMDTTQEYYSILMVLLIPFYALLSRLVFVNRKEFNYTEHLVMSMYIMAQFSLVSSFTNIIFLVFGLSTQILGTISIFFQIAFFAYCYKRIYKLSSAGIVLHTLFFLAIMVAIMLLLIMVGFVIALIFKDSDAVKSLIESQRAINESQLPIKDSIN